MIYALAKKLKNAGFPDVSICERVDEHEIKGCGQCDMEQFPTLEELIEACGDEFEELGVGGEGLNDSKFHAVSRGRTIEFGDTPSESVANLWLVLNKKDDG